jgi:predicted nucleic acid-binding protein
MKDNAKVFVDTNVLVYGYDNSAGGKHTAAFNILKDLWNTGRGIISTQVLQEFFVTVTKKIPNPLDLFIAKNIVKDFLKWKLIIVDGGILLDAIDIHHEHRNSFWDSLIIAAAIEGGANTLFSEDLTDGQVIKGVTIMNPFKEC